MAGFELLFSSWTRTATTAVAAWALYLLYLAIYRLYISPLANFPGPKLAALSLWYEFYYDVIKRGRYTWRIGEMHKQYGPIVRINPYEIHIDDPSYYNEIYTGPTRRRNKWAWSAKMFGVTSSVFGVVPHEEHRRHRQPLDVFFSKASILKINSMIMEAVELMCSRLEGFRETGEPVNLRHAFAALTMDVIAQYSFGKNFNCLDEPDFAPMWAIAVDSISEQTHITKQMPWVLEMMRLIPLSILEKLNPHIMRLIRWQMHLRTEVIEQLNGKAAENEKQGVRTIFNALLQPGKIPAEDLTPEYLTHEAQGVVAAGQVTTTHYLNTTAYHIIANPPIFARLKAELKSATPAGILPSQQVLERLPYLSAVVLEGYRISYGPVHRLQRIAPDEDLVYKDYIIPAGTPVSMSSKFMHDNEDLFPDHTAFKPERWLERGAKEKLSGYLVNFSKGTRACLGKELAVAEIYLSLAAVFSRFDFELYKTTREDIDVEHDFFNPAPRDGSVGLRVIMR